MSAYEPPKSSNSLQYNPLNFILSTDGISLDLADARYVRIGSVATLASLTASIIQTDSLSVGGTNLSNTDLAFISGITAGIPAANKALVLNANNQITDTLRLSNTNIRVDRTVNGSILQSINGTSQFTMFHFNNGSFVMGMSSAHTLSLQTNNMGRLTIDSNGAVSIGGSLSCGSLTVNGSPITESPFLTDITAGIAAANKAMTLDANREINNVVGITFQNPIVGNQRLIARDISFIRNIVDAGVAESSKALVLDSSRNIVNIGYMEMNTLGLNSSTRTIGGFSNITGCLWFSNTARSWGMRQISNDVLSVLSLSAGGSYTSALTYNHSSTPRWDFSTSSSILLQSPTTALEQTIHITMGNTSTKGRFQLETFFVGSNQNTNRLLIKNTDNDNQGIVLRADGRVSINLEGDGIVGSPIGALHVRGGINTTFDTSRSFLNPSGVQTTSSTNTVPISVYATNWIWAVSGFVAVSDRRVKTDIESISLDEAKKLLDVKPIKYRSTDSIDNNVQAGIIAQDLIRVGLTELIGMVPNDDLKEDIDEHGTYSPQGIQLVAKYDRITVYLLKLVQEQQKQIDEQDEQIKHLTTIIYSNIEQANCRQSRKIAYDSTKDIHHGGV